MTKLIKTRLTLIWAFLSLLTVMSWWLGNDYQPDTNRALHHAGIGIILVAFFKIRMIIRSFMEVRHANLLLKIVFDVWIVVVCAEIIFLYHMGTANR